MSTAAFDVSARPAITVESILAAALCVGVSIEFVFSGAAGTTLSEAVIYAGALWVFFARGLHPRGAHFVLLFCLALSVASIAARGWDRAYGPYLRTFIDLAAALVLCDHLVRNTYRTRMILKWLVVIGTALAIYSVWQAVLGFGSLPDIYSVGGVPQAARLDRPEIAGEFYRQLGVMRWKADEINRALGTDTVQGLGYGFHWFSNNFGEYLVFVSAAAWMLLAPRRLVLLLLVQVILALAVMASAARTAGVGLVVVNVGMAFMCFRAWRPALLIAVALMAILLGPSVWAVFFFDEGGTISGRNAINSLALAYATADPAAVLFGGDAPMFLRASGFNVHLLPLYYWLFGGALVAVSMTLLFAVWAVKAGWVALQTRNVIASGAFMALTWFLLYGLTWSPITAPNTAILVALFVAISSRSAQLSTRQEPSAAS